MVLSTAESDSRRDSHAHTPISALEGKPHGQLGQSHASNRRGTQEISPLLRLPFTIIGQESAAKLVMESVYAHIAMKTNKPLLLAFAGLSGHGKTELAKQMGEVLSLPLLEVDCAQRRMNGLC